MAKHKDDWERTIKNVLSRKRSDRRYLIPRTLVEAIADRIHQINPTKEILTNTLCDLYSMAFEHGYGRKCSDIKFFKAKQDKVIFADWNKIKEELDDEIHSKNK